MHIVSIEKKILRKDLKKGNSSVAQIQQQSEKIIADSDRSFFEPMAVFITYLINAGK